jgi:polyisoprenoid-binding protein YceI
MNRRMHKGLIVLGWLAVAAVAGLGAANQAMVAAQSEVGYVITETGVPVEGNFGRFDAQIDLRPDKMQASSVSFTVDTASVIFPATDVQRELAKPDWFDTARYPKAEFRSTRIRALGADRLEITGTLTIKGRAREVIVPVSLSRSGAMTYATGKLTIKRLEYGIGLGEWGDTSLVDDEVQIKFKIALSGMASG